MIYCKLCYPKIWHTPLPADPRAIAAKIQEGEDGGGCPRCGGKVSCQLRPQSLSFKGMSRIEIRNCQKRPALKRVKCIPRPLRK